MVPAGTGGGKASIDYGGTCVVHSEVDVAEGGELGVIARVHRVMHDLRG